MHITGDRGQSQGTKVGGRDRGSENCASRLPRGEVVPRGTTLLDSVTLLLILPLNGTLLRYV